MNARAVMSSKGQLVVPKAVREAHGWGEGTEFEFIESGNSVVLQPVGGIDPRFPPISWEEFEKIRIKVDRLLPDDREIDQILLKEAARRYDASGG